MTVLPAAITTEPAGAEVLAKPYGEPDGEWERLGVSPVEGAFLPFTPHRVRITRPGFAPLEAVVVPQTPSRLTLAPEKDARPGMVYVSAGRSQFAGAPPADLPAFWLDRHELTNRECKAFVDAGGYRRPELWKHPFVVAAADPVRGGDGASSATAPAAPGRRPGRWAASRRGRRTSRSPA